MRKYLILISWVLCLTFIASRYIWEWSSPILPEHHKGWIYFRDLLCLTPAAFFGYWAGINNPLRIGNISNVNFTKLLFASFIYAVFACYFIYTFIFHSVAHIIDEIAYLFQAKVYAGGDLAAHLPDYLFPFFKIRYFLNQNDNWFTVFFPGQSLLLSVGIGAKIPSLINPITNGLLLIITALAAKKLYNRETSCIACLLMIISPFFLFQGASFFSHPAAAFFFLGSSYFILKPLKRRYLSNYISGFLCGCVFLFRPLSAFIIFLFALYKAIKVRKSEPIISQFFFASIGFIPFLFIIFYINYKLTGSPWFNQDPNAAQNQAFSLGLHTLSNILINISGLAIDLLGVPIFSIIPFVAYIIFDKSETKWDLVAILVIYIITYGLYPFHGFSYGPRYYYEILPFFVITSSRGILLLFQSTKLLNINQLTTVLIVTAFISYFGTISSKSIVFSKRGLIYESVRSVNTRIDKPAIVFVKAPDLKALKWRIEPYNALFQLNDPFFKAPVIYAHDLGINNYKLSNAFPNRNIYYYDTASDTLTQK